MSDPPISDMDFKNKMAEPPLNWDELNLKIDIILTKTFSQTWNSAVFSFHLEIIHKINFKIFFNFFNSLY